MKIDVRCDHCQKDITLGVIWRRVTFDDGSTMNVHRDCIPALKEKREVAK